MTFIKIKQIFEQKKNEVNLFIKKTQLENDVSKIITDQSFKVLGEIVENGFILTEKQHDKLCDFLIKSEDHTKCRELISSGCSFSDKTFKRLFKESPNIFFTNNQITDQIFRRIKNDESFNFELFKIWEKTTLSFRKVDWDNYDQFKSQDRILSFFEKNWNHFFEEKNSSKLIRSLSKIKHSSSFDHKSINQDISNKVSKYLQNNSNTKKNEIINKTKEVFLGENVEKNISKLSEEQALSFSIKKLPETIKNLILKVESNCQKLNQSKDIEIQHIINQTIDKLLPETLKKYSLMDDEYKNTMKNKDGKSAQDLLIESLNNINNRLVKLIENKNENQLLEMEIGATFTRKLNNG